MKYFGTDGIRGIVGEKLNEQLIKKLGKALVRFYKTHNLPANLIVGNDTRQSSDYILAVLQTILLAGGIEVHNIGICSSPCLAFLTRKHRFPLGLMISASHNPKEYNGLKFFNINGEKVADSFEQEIETYMDKPYKLPATNFATCKNAFNLKADYVSMLKSLKKVEYPCILDCASGGSSEIARQVFGSTKIINANPNGENINVNAGCTHIEELATLCQQKGLIGFAFDGDADRVMAVDKTGTVLDGDKILYILSKFYLKSGQSVVGTINTNSGLAEAISKHNLNLVRASVGDKRVYEQMLKHHSMLGGEESGHIIIKKYTNTGDGILTAICLMNILHLTGLNFADLLTGYTEFATAKQNIKLTKPFSTTQDIKLLIDKYTSDNARIVIRPSGTEPVLRLLVEHKDKKTATQMLERLVYNIKLQQQ